MPNGYIFSSYTYKGKFRALYSKLMLKVEAAAAPKVYCIRRCSIGWVGPASSLKLRKCWAGGGLERGYLGAVISTTNVFKMPYLRPQQALLH